MSAQKKKAGTGQTEPNLASRYHHRPAMNIIVSEEHNFDAVNEKIAEAEFFLRDMANTSDLFAFRCYMSAFLSAARTTTLSIQRFKHLKGFEAWYKPHREVMKSDPVARFLLDLRNEHLHGGPSPITRSQHSGGESQFYFSDRVIPDGLDLLDVVTVCRGHFVNLLRVVHDAYAGLGASVDAHQYYTKEHFASIGRDIDSAEIEVYGWVCESLVEEGFDEDDRWHELRSKFIDCGIQALFYSYLGVLTPQPVEPDHYRDFAYSPEDQGWHHTPAGFGSVESYWTHAGIEPVEV